MSHLLGLKDAPIQLLGYMDFQCPHCARAANVVRELQNTYGGQMSYVFRHFPLVEIHPLARLCAQAAEAADAQGEFWRMHDLIFQNQPHLSKKVLDQIADKIGLDSAEFKRGLANRRLEYRIDQDIKLGQRRDVQGTPTLFLNDELYPAEADFEALSQAIEDELTSRSSAA